MCILRPFLAATRVIRNLNPDPSSGNEPTTESQQRQPIQSLQDGEDYQRSTAVAPRKPGPTYPRQRISKYRMRELDNAVAERRRRVLATPTTPSHLPQQCNIKGSTLSYAAPTHGATNVDSDPDSDHISSDYYSSPLDKQSSIKRPREQDEQDPYPSTDSSKEQRPTRRRMLMANNQLISSASSTSPTSHVLTSISTPTVPYFALRRMASEAPDLRRSTHHSAHFWGSDKSNDSDTNVDVGVSAMDGSVFSQQHADKERDLFAGQKDKDSDQGSSSDKEEQSYDDCSDVDDGSQDSSNVRQGGDDSGSDGISGCEDGDYEDDEDDGDEDDGDDIAEDKIEDNLSMAANDSNSDNSSDTPSPFKDDKGKACQIASPSHRGSASSSGTHRSANVHAQTASPAPVLQPPSHHMKIYLGGFSDGCLHGYKEAQRHAHNALTGRVAMGLDSSPDNSTTRSNLTTNTQDLLLSSSSTPPAILPLHTLTAGQLQDAAERPLSESGQRRAAARLDHPQQRPPHMFGFGIIPGQGFGYGETIAPGFVRALPGFSCPYSTTSQQGQNQVQGSTARGIAHTAIPPASPASTVSVPVPSAASVAVPALMSQVQRQAGDEEGQCTAIAKKTGLRCKRRVRANGYCHLH